MPWLTLWNRPLCIGKCLSPLLEDGTINLVSLLCFSFCQVCACPPLPSVCRGCLLPRHSCLPQVRLATECVAVNQTSLAGGETDNWRRHRFLRDYYRQNLQEVLSSLSRNPSTMSLQCSLLDIQRPTTRQEIPRCVRGQTARFF